MKFLFYFVRIFLKVWKLFYFITFVLYENQPAFLKKRSTLTNLAVFRQFDSTKVVSGGQVNVIYTDLSKAFHKVIYSIIISKLDHLFGFYLNLIKLIDFYLSQGHVFVPYNYTLHFTSESSVPQGSDLRSLFVLLIDDISELLSQTLYCMIMDLH